MNWFQELLSNGFLLVALSSWFWAQLIKTILHAIVTKRVDFTRLVGDGGMPSGHSATVSSLATAAALVYGLGSFEFAIALVFAIVVCKDAMGVRLETGKQAAIINDIVEAFNVLTSEEKLSDAKLKEFVGHTPLQVIAGILLGIVNAALLYTYVF
jgi:acid phosphatase family membrane protein YuiD